MTLRRLAPAEITSVGDDEVQVILSTSNLARDGHVLQARGDIEPRDVPAEHAARRLGLTCGAFVQALPGLLARGFPAADPTTGNYDLDAVDAWRRRRNPGLFDEAGALKTGATARARLEALRGG